MGEGTVGTLILQILIHVAPVGLTVFEFLHSAIKIRWEHAVWHFFLLNVYNVIVATYSYAFHTSVFAGFDWYRSPLLASGLTCLIGSVWFGCFYLVMLLQNFKDTGYTGLTLITFEDKGSGQVVILN